MIRLVLFDIDGTLIRTGGAGVKAFERAFQSEFGVPQGTERIHFAGRTDTGLVREMCINHGIAPTPEHFRRFFDTYVFWLDHILQHTRGEVCIGVTLFLEALRLRPEPPMVGLLTGNIQLGAEIKLRHYGLWDGFELGAFADDHEDRNEIAAIALKRAGARHPVPLRGKEVLVIGDTPRDIACARHVGARVLAVGTGGATLQEMEHHRPDWLVESLADIDPDRVCA